MGHPKCMGIGWCQVNSWNGVEVFTKPRFTWCSGPSKVVVMWWKFTKLGAGCRKLERLYLDALEIAAGCCRLFSADLRRFSTPTGKCSWVRAKCKTGCEVDRTKRRAPFLGNHWWRIVGRLGWLGYVGTNGNVIYIDLWYCHTLTMRLVWFTWLLWGSHLPCFKAL